MEKPVSHVVINDDYIFRLTDDTGMLQHGKFGIPDPRHGYTTDDNARALIMALMLYERSGKKKYLDLVYRYASFLLNARNSVGMFKNVMGYDRKWLDEEGSEDCFGRCLLALGYAVSSTAAPQGMKHGFSHLLNGAIPHVSSLKSPRAKAYSLIGLAYLVADEAKDLVKAIARSLCGHYEEYKDNGWNWFENIVTYSNHILPWSLFTAFRVTGEPRFLDVAEESLAFLGKLTLKDGYFKPIGCHGWFRKGENPAAFDEQPIETCGAILTYLEAFEITGNLNYLQNAKICYDWYHGANSKGIMVVDPVSGGCYDGLTEQGINLNMGAESLISYWISTLKINKFMG
ncbi:MAG TPA: glycosyltransferase [Bacillota bacterium]